MHRLLVVVGQQVGHFGHGLAGHDDADILHSSHRPFHDGQAVAVQRHDGELVGQDLEQFTGVRRFFLVLADGVQGAVDHVLQHAGLDGQGLLGTGVGQLREVGGRHGLDLKLGNTTLDRCFSVLGGGDGDLTGRHPADHAAEQLCVQHDLTGLLDIGLDGGHDAHFQVVAGEGELEALGFQQDAFQHGDGGTHGDGFGYAVDGGAQKNFIAYDVQAEFSPLFSPEQQTALQWKTAC